MAPPVLGYRLLRSQRLAAILDAIFGHTNHRLLEFYLQILHHFHGLLRVSKLLSFKMAFALMHASITDFFDRIPIGRILNRFLKDMGEIDNMLGYSVSYFIQLSLIAFVDLAATVIGSSPIVIIFLVLYLYFCLKVQQYYMHAAREVTRLRSMSASPTIQAFLRAFRRSFHSSV